MKKILFLLLGLMSLVGLSSCEDKFVYDEEKEFVPLGYLPKTPIFEEDDTPEALSMEITTLQILGAKGLVVDQIEKDDWKIITPASIVFRGTEPLQLGQKVYEFEDNIPRSIMDIKTNYEETIPIAFGNTKVTYQYMGEDVELIPLGDVRLIVDVVERGRGQGEYFAQFGDIEISLTIDYLVVKKHKFSFVVLDPRIESPEG